MENILRCPISNKVLQFDSKTQSWFIEYKENFYPIDGNGSDVVLAVLPFLEFSIEKFENNVRKILLKYPNIQFPYETFIRAGFIHGSRHWTDCALEWLSGLSHRLDANFSKELEVIVQNRKRYSQKSRHLAWKLLKRGY